MASKFHKDLITTDLHPPGYMQVTDPGSIGAGKYWFDFTGGKNVLNVRNEANGAWRVVSGAFFSSTDPGVIGAGRLWVDTSLGVGAYILKVRNLANSGWEIITTSLVSDGTYTSTAQEINSEVVNGPYHRADQTIHRSINDSAGAGDTTALWSANKIFYSITGFSPIGSVIQFAGTGIPGTDYLLCDGTSYSTVTYVKLYAAIGYTWGNDGGLFRVPNLQEQFVRGSSGSRVVGSYETHDIQAHTHNVIYRDYARQNEGPIDEGVVGVGGNKVTPTASSGGTETRPNNYALAYWIRAKVAGRADW